MPSWDQYLWDRNLVALDPLLEHAGGLQLLDVVVKNRSAGILAEPTLLKAGSIISLQTTATDVHADWSATRASILDHQQKLVGARQITTDVFRKAEQLENYQCNTDSGYGILASIVGFLRSGASSATYGSIYVEDVVNEWVVTEFLERLLSGDGVDSKPLWKPNVQKIKRCSSGPHDPEKLELWVVTELKYGKTISLKDKKAQGASAMVDASTITGIPGSSGGVTVSRMTNGEVVASAGSASKIPFAFKAIRLVYNNEGELVQKKLDLGNRKLKKRATSSRTALVDADKNPNYHMEGLFNRAPRIIKLGTSSTQPDGGVQEIHLQCLRFVGAKE